MPPVFKYETLKASHRSLRVQPDQRRPKSVIFNAVVYRCEIIYKMTVQDVGTCVGHDSIGVKITFTNPPNVQFGICSRCFNCGTGNPEQCREPGAGGTTEFYVQAWDDCGDDETHDQYVHIYYLSGNVSSCGNWKLLIEGDQTSDHNRSCGGND